MTIDPQQFGQTMQKVDDLVGVVKDHIKASDDRHEDAEKRLNSLEEIWRFAKWGFVVLGLLWPIIVPLLQQIFLKAFGVEDSSLITFIPLNLF